MHYYNLFVHFYFVKTVHSYFIIFNLVFFHSTYNAGSYITHVGIYLGNNRMFHAGDPIGYADLTSPYWQQHLVGAGRIKQ